MIRKVRATIIHRELLQRGDHVIVAVSGGPDSMSLLQSLLCLRGQMEFRVSMAHVHHGIRGSLADEDEAFVQTFAWETGTQIHIDHVHTPREARRDGVSLEMAARSARIRFFSSLSGLYPGAVVATGHTQNDQAETVLLRLLRGAGATGLSGMRYKSTVQGVHFIRPLLDCTREDVLQFLKEHELAYRVDASNEEDRHMRNRVRNELIPLLRSRFNPSIIKSLVRTGEILSEEDRWLSGRAKEGLSRCRVLDSDSVLDTHALRSEPIALRRRILRAWLLQCDVDATDIDMNLISRLESLISGDQGLQKVPITGLSRVVRSYNLLRLEPSRSFEIPNFNAELFVPGKVDLPDCGLHVLCSIVRVENPRRPGRMGEFPVEACLRMPMKSDRMYVRRWKDGDRINPLGMHGTVKLQDVFVNRKVSRDKRHEVPVFCCRHEVIWVPGYGVAKRWAVQPGDLQSVLIQIVPS